LFIFLGEDSSSENFDHLNDPAEPLLVFNDSEQPEKKADGLFAKMRNDVALKKGFIISCMMMIAQVNGNEHKGISL
jgi:hypothetical protein